MLQPALTPAQCYIRQCQISCIEVSDLRFNSYLYCISMIFAFLRLPVCPCSPSTTTQPLLHRVAAQREPWESPTDFSAAWAWATHLHTVGRSTLPAPCPGQHTQSRSAHPVPVSAHQGGAKFWLSASTFGQMLTALELMCVLKASCSLYPHAHAERGQNASNMQGSPFCQASAASLKGKLVQKLKS